MSAKIIWRDTSNQLREKQVDESEAEEEAERIRALPNVKAYTVKIVFEDDSEPKYQP